MPDRSDAPLASIGPLYAILHSVQDIFHGGMGAVMLGSVVFLIIAWCSSLTTKASDAEFNAADLAFFEKRIRPLLAHSGRSQGFPGGALYDR